MHELMNGILKTLKCVEWVGSHEPNVILAAFHLSFHLFLKQSSGHGYHYSAFTHKETDLNMSNKFNRWLSI